MATSPFILAHDLGTTGNKASLFDAQGSLVGSAFAGYPTAYPQPNWAEQEPDDWWRAVCQATRQLLAQSGVVPGEIAAVSFSGQMMGCVALGRDGNPLRSCIIWADQRAQPQAGYLAQVCGAAEVYRRTGHRVSPAYSAPKILWLRDRQPDLFAAAACFLQPKDYAVYRLTGTLATDYSDASGTLLFDLEGHRWHRPFLDALGLDEERLPRLYASDAVVGRVTTGAAAATGLAAGTPVVIGGGDGACASAGAGVIEPGAAYCSVGSSAWVSVSSLAPVLDPQERSFTFHHLHPQRYSPMGTMQAAGGARDWAWRLLQTPGQELDAAAAEVAPGAGGVLFLPYLLGERSPHWDPLARAAWLGMAMPTDRPTLARAVLEGVALNLRLILDGLRAQVAGIRAIRLIGGGSQSQLWRQILAGCFGLPVHTLALQSEATVWGAAVAGGVAVGLYDWQMAAAQARIVETTHPDPAHAAVYDELVTVFADAYTALAPLYARLAQIRGQT
ncbi:MAG: xylulokinase [Chloroflexi bacterium]|nr:MAG: xylulokinase [Chloroflexota bacterium]